MKLNQIEEQVKKDYVGQEFQNGWGTWSKVADYVCEKLKEEYGKDFIYRSSNVSSQEINITYKGWTVFKVIFKKQRGEKIYNSWIGNSNYKWNIKDIMIREYHLNFNKENVIEEMEAIDEYTKKKNEYTNAVEIRAIEVFKYIKNVYNLDDDGKVREIVRYIDKNFYDIERKANAS